ncbi:hypothetical protein ACIQXZ_28900 [Bacillus thuringiensis]
MNKFVAVLLSTVVICTLIFQSDLLGSKQNKSANASQTMMCKMTDPGGG